LGRFIQHKLNGKSFSAEPTRLTADQAARAVSHCLLPKKYR